MRAVILRQNVGKVDFFQLLQRDLGNHFFDLDGEAGARLGHGDLLGVVGEIEAVALDLLDQLVRFFVVVGVLHLHAVFLIIRRQIDGIARRGVVVELEIGKIVRRKAREHRLIELVRVQRDGRRAGRDADDARVLVDRDGRLGKLLFDLVGGLVDDLPDVLRVQIQRGFEVDGVLRRFGGGIGAQRLERAAVAAIFHGLVNGLVRVERDVCDLRVKLARPVRKDDAQRIRGVGLVDRALDRRDGGAALEPADVHAGNIDVRENGVAVFDRESVAADGDNDDRGDGAGNDRNFCAGAQPAALFRRGTVALGSGVALRRGLLRRLLRTAPGFKSAFLFDGDPSYPETGACSGRSFVLSNPAECWYYDNYIIRSAREICNANSSKKA